MPEGAIAVGVLFSADADGRSFVIGDALLDVARAANRPFFVVGSWLVGTGAVGGHVFDAELAGRLTGGTVLRALEPVRWIFGGSSFCSQLMRRVPS